MYSKSISPDAPGPLQDLDLVDAFESLSLPVEDFGHAEHVRVTFTYLRRDGLLGTLSRLPDALRRFATHHGAAGRYHETVTWAHVFLIHQRMVERPELDSWSSFARANPDLLRWRDGAFFAYYGPEVLDSDLARRTFVLPR